MFKQIKSKYKLYICVIVKLFSKERCMLNAHKNNSESLKNYARLNSL